MSTITRQFALFEHTLLHTSYLFGHKTKGVVEMYFKQKLDF